MTDAPIEEFYGYLGRAEVTSERATVRMYPFGFSTGATNPVFEVLIDYPNFTETDLNSYLGGEFEVMLYSDYVQMDDVLEGLVSRTLKGKSASAIRRPYDLQDYVERVLVLDQYLAERSAELRSARKKLDRLASVAHELVRRAEIKANVSHEQSLRQSGAIEVLQRMLAELELGD